jgi:hypothetical protein
MTRAISLTLALAGVVGLTLGGAADADSVRIGVYSQKASPTKARIGAGVQVTASRPGRAGRIPRRAGRAPVSPGGSPPSPGLPVLPSSSPRLRDRTPAGPGSRWIRVRRGRRCVYVPGSPGPCFDVVPRGGRRGGGPPLDPAAIAASMAQRLPLVAGRIEASPSARDAGLTGADSWFWLSPRPDERVVSVSFGGERVTVTAMVDAVSWEFGDGRRLRASPGVPYRSDEPPARAVRHRYETRCLAGDRGRNPYVLETCRATGYRVEATVEWAISYEAAGPITASGGLPSRTTATAIAYPVSEARGFLTNEGGT